MTGHLESAAELGVCARCLALLSGLAPESLLLADEVRALLAARGVAPASSGDACPHCCGCLTQASLGAACEELEKQLRTHQTEGTTFSLHLTVPPVFDVSSKALKLLLLNGSSSSTERESASMSFPSLCGALTSALGVFLGGKVVLTDTADCTVPPLCAHSRPTSPC